MPNPMVFALVLLALSPRPGLAAGARVEKLLGSASFQGRELKEGDALSGTGVFATRARSFARLSMEAWKSEIVIGPDTRMDIDLQSAKGGSPKHYQLVNGICRWVSRMRSATMKGGHVFTRSASMGVRGTDFEVQHREESGETEIVVFEGRVLMKSELAASERLLESAQWGGVGGKFGKKIGKPLDLSPAQLEEFRKRTQAALPPPASGSGRPEAGKGSGNY